jgi:hypothetical protein
MTEAEWLGCNDPQKMLEFVRGKTSDRKLRLFAVACANQAWPIILSLNDTYQMVETIGERREVKHCREALLAAEAYADESTHTETIASVREKLARHIEPLRALDSFQGMDHGKAQLWAMRVVAATLHKTGDQAAMETLRLILPARQRRWLFKDWLCKAPPSGQELDFNHDGWPQLIQEIFYPLPLFTEKPACFNRSVTAIAQAIYDERAFERIPILADALEDAGCSNAEILAHCRGPGPHVKGCWALDVLQKKE